MGLDLFFGSIALKVKKIGRLTFIFQILLMFLTDTLTKTSFSDGLGKVIPLTNRINLARQSVSDLLVPKTDLIFFIVDLTLIWLLLAVFIFSYAEKKVRRGGDIKLPLISLSLPKAGFFFLYYLRSPFFNFPISACAKKYAPLSILTQLGVAPT